MNESITSLINDVININVFNNNKSFYKDDKTILFLIPLDYILVADKSAGFSIISSIIENAKSVDELKDKFSDLKSNDKYLYNNIRSKKFEELIQTINELDDLETENNLIKLLNKIENIVNKSIDANINTLLKDYFKQEKINAKVNLYSLIKDYCLKRQSQAQKKVESPNSETSNKLELYFYPILPLSTKNKISRYFIAPIDYLFYNNGQDVSLEKNFKERYNKLKSILGEGIDNIKKLDSRYNTKVSQTFNGEKNLKMIKDNLINLENKNIYEMIIDIYSQIFTKVYANDKKNDINKIINNLTQACNEKKIKPEDLTITTDINHFKRAAILFIALIQAYFFNTDNEKEQLIYPTLRNDVTYWHSLEVNNYLGVMEQYPYASLQRFLALKQLANEGNLLARMDVGSGYNYGTLLNDGPATLPLDNNDFISKQYLEFDWDNFIPGQLLLKKINGTLNSLRTSRVLIVDLVAYCQKYVDIVFASENYDQFKDKINNQEFIDLLIHLSYNSLSDYHIKYCWYLLTYQSYVNHQRIPYYIKRYFDENKDKLIEIFPAEIAIISKFYHQKQITMDNLIENMNLEIDFNIIRKLCGELKMIPSNILYYVGRLRKDRSFIEMGITKKDPNCINYGLSFNTASVYNPNDSLKNKVLILIEKNNPDNIAELRSKKIDILKLLIELQEQINSYNEKISEAYLNSNYDLAQDEVSKQNEYKELFNKLMDVLQSV